MKQLLLICAVVALVGGCASTPKVVPANIANPIVEKAIRERLKKPTGELTKADLEKVTELYLGRNQLTDLTGLEKLNQLTTLTLTLNSSRLTDVKGLEKLTQLKWLGLENNQLTELPKGLEKLTKLRRLYLHNNQLTNVKGLENLTQLKVLSLSGNQMTDVKGLEKLTHLTSLDLMDNQLTEVPKGLEKLSKLTVLSLRNNPDLNKAQIGQLQKALPKCYIGSNPTK